MSLLLSTRYKESGTPPTDTEYLADLTRMLDFFDGHPHSKEMFAGARVFKVCFAVNKVGHREKCVLG